MMHRRGEGHPGGILAARQNSSMVGSDGAIASQGQSSDYLGGFQGGAKHQIHPWCCARQEGIEVHPPSLRKKKKARKKKMKFLQQFKDILKKISTKFQVRQMSDKEDLTEINCCWMVVPPSISAGQHLWDPFGIPNEVKNYKILQERRPHIQKKFHKISDQLDFERKSYKQNSAQGTGCCLLSLPFNYKTMVSSPGCVPFNWRPSQSN